MNQLLGGLSPSEFLNEYWQKKPLLIRGAFPDFESPVTPEQLMELACLDDADARLILEEGGEEPWQLFFGPFDAADFEDMPESHWTLLVQEVNRHVPAVDRLLDHFRFIPNWRVDDIMISYAAEEGGVGPHVDNYDVFLIQGRGQRRWQIDPKPVIEENLIPDIDVSVLADFKAVEEWVLDPGDILYLPPRVAHNGISLGDCMTLSVGFRAPSHSELIAGFFSYVAEINDHPFARYSDPDLTEQESPGLITPSALEKIVRIIRSAGENEDEVAHWFGRFVTEPTRSFYPLPPLEDSKPDLLLKDLRAGGGLRRTAGVIWAYLPLNEEEAELYVHGEVYRVPVKAAPILSGDPLLTEFNLSPFFGETSFLHLLSTLVNEGFLEPVPAE